MYYVYILRCSDHSLYTGITSDLKRRMDEHFSKGKKSAKYTRFHDAQQLEIAWSTENRPLASKLEYHLKRLSKSKKEALILKQETIELLLSEKVDTNVYQEVNLTEFGIENVNVNFG